MTRPKGIHTKALTQQDHDRINILYRDALRTRKEIEAITGFTESQIKRALATKFVSRGTGRPPKLTKAQEDELVAYVTANREQQAMSYLELSRELFGHEFGEYAIRSTLRRRGFCRYNGKTRPEPGKGFAMSYGVFQQVYFDNWTLEGDRSSTGFIGTTANGVMYLSMPLLFALFTRRWARRRRLAALCGTVIACISFFLSSYSTSIGHLVATQGITSALGCALIYSPITLSLGEWYSASNRALAYGLSCKNVVGTSCPFLVRALIDNYGFRTALRAWTGIVGGTSIIAISMIPTHPSKLVAHETRARRIPWDFLRHRSIYFYSIAIIFQSSGYGIPQTYLSTYARDILLLSQTSGTLMLALFNAPGIIASSLFGWLSDNKRIALSAQTVSAIPPLACAIATFLLWGLTTVQGGIGLLVVFSVTFGFFAGGYSATWGGMLKQLEVEASERNEAIDSGMLYGLLNGVRGIGYAGGGFAGVGLLDAGTITASSLFGYGTSYGPIILFTGITSLLGGWGVLWRWDLWRRILLLVSGLGRLVDRLRL
ncbi:uncharacterized protein PG986_002421 [Apiospora aurea]|uniref:Major facilitator superfamily (MFS) profile domain-containing protein n=1 Tax=Apiospora aurea TaxID=335848 RepID=A0ABR1QNS5_9PEZI